MEEAAPGQFGDRMLAARGGRGESFEALSCLACREEVQRLCLGEMALEDGDDDGGNVRYPGEGAEHPHRRPFQAGPVRQGGHTVAAQGPLEAPSIPVGEPGPVGVEPLEEGEEVLLSVELIRDVGLGSRLLLDAGSVEGTDLREQVEEGALLGEEGRIIGRARRCEALVAVDGGGAPGRVEIEPQEVVAQGPKHADLGVAELARVGE